MRQHSGIGVLDKAVGVLRAAATEPCGLAELCERTGLPRATAHRLAVGLEVHGLLHRGSDGRWSPGPTLAELAAGGADPLLEAAAAVLPRLRDITGESVQLYRRDGSHRVCVATAEPASGLRDTVPVGARMPMTAGSGAKVLAAWAEPAIQRAVLSDATFTERVLLDVRRRGWAQSVAERASGVASVSAPVRDSGGQVVAAVSVSGPVDRIGRRPGVRWAADLLAAAEALQHRL
ncbi:MAG: IclR family transcriptional regulator [Pseudonocardia sp.]|nr:IclR family transcriptional regulator [Pseudonocardia sp.]